MAEEKRKSIIGGAGEKEFASMLFRINDRRVDKFRNEYLELLDKGKSAGEAKSIIMKKINTLKIPLGTLNVRKS